MKLRSLYTLFTLIVMVKGAWWAAVTQPFILSLGSLMAGVDQEVLDVHTFNWGKWLPWTKWGKQ